MQNKVVYEFGEQYEIIWAGHLAIGLFFNLCGLSANYEAKSSRIYGSSDDYLRRFGLFLSRPYVV